MEYTLLSSSVYTDAIMSRLKMIENNYLYNQLNSALY